MECHLEGHTVNSCVTRIKTKCIKRASSCLSLSSSPMVLINKKLFEMYVYVFMVRVQGSGGILRLVDKA